MLEGVWHLLVSAERGDGNEPRLQVLAGKPGLDDQRAGSERD
jgi:hypothetical protein